MTETEILKYCSTKHDSKGRFLAKLVREDIYNDILKISPTLKHIKRNNAITAFYSGYREIPICLHDDCNNFTNWSESTKKFSSYCCVKCSNSDPKKDATTVKNNLAKYGVPRASMTEESKAKLLETNLERFGCISSAQHQSVKDKALATNLERYGHVATEIGNVTNLEHYNDKNFITKNFIKDGMFLKDEFTKYFTCGQVAAHATLNRLGIEYRKFSSMKETSIERKVKEFLIENNIRVETKYRDKYELDLFLPDYNIGIELDGLYFHAYGGGNKTHNDSEYYKQKHAMKFKYFLDRGIRVIFIWENEIECETKFQNWKYFLLDILGFKSETILSLNQIKLYDTKDAREYNDFLFDNILEPLIDYSNAFKIYYENIIIGVICFKFLGNDIQITNIAINRKYINENLKVELLKYLCNYYKRNIIFPVYFRHGNIKYYEGMKIYEYNKSNHLIFKLGKAKEILLGLAYEEEVYSNDGNYSMIWDSSLEFVENLKINNFLSLWDCGSFAFKIEHMEN